MAVSVKDNSQSTNFSSYIVISDLQDDATENDLLTGGAGSVNVLIIENESNSSGDANHFHLYDSNSPTVGAGGTAQEMKIRNRNSAGVARIMTVFIKNGHSFTNLSAAASTAADASDNPTGVTNLIILGS